MMETPFQAPEGASGPIQQPPHSFRSACADYAALFPSIDQQLNAPASYARNISCGAAAEITEHLVTSVTANRELLRQKLTLHGDIFMSRWKKRSRDKRAELLLLANTDLPERRCQDLLTLINTKDSARDWGVTRTPRMRLRLLLPYLATEPLKKHPELLLALLHHRTDNTPSDWVAFDMHEFYDAWESGLLDVNFSPGCMAAYGRNYGNIVPCDKELFARGDIITFPRAQLVLEAQLTLMEFLVRIVDITLQGANLDTPSCAKWSSACTNGFSASGDLVQWSDYSSAAFSAPPLLDIDKCIATADLRFNAAADHLCLLQTVPAYARRYIRVLQQGHDVRTCFKDVFRWIDGCMSFDVMNLYWWSCIREEAVHVKQVQTRLQAQNRRGYALPAEYENALAAFEVILGQQMKFRGDYIRLEARQRHGFEQNPHLSAALGQLLGVRESRTTAPETFFSDPLYWCIMNLTTELTASEEVRSLDRSHLFTFLDDHLDRAPAEERARLDQIIVERLSDLAANNQIILSIGLSRPRNQPGDKDAALLETEDRLSWKDPYGPDSLIDHSPGRAALLRKFSETPTPHGRRDKAWLDQFDEVHSTLADYWKAMRRTALAHMREPNSARCLQADMDATHLAEVGAYRQAVLDEISARQTIPEVAAAFLGLDLDDSAPNTIFKSHKKKKTKSRPVQPSATDEALAAAEVTPVPIQHPPDTNSIPSIATTKRAAALFKKMFSRDCDGAGQGCDWDHFVRCMQDSGFAACSKDGSAMQFEFGDKGKIVFHKPHPVPKVDPVMLRAMGKRLGKWFGFGEGSFVQAS